MKRWKSLTAALCAAAVSYTHLDVYKRQLINRRRRPGFNEACEMYEVAVPDDALTEEDEDILNYDDIDDPNARSV